MYKRQVLCVTAVAAGPSLWQYMQARQGPFAGLAQTVEGAVCCLLYTSVPCYYVDGVKVHEGHAERADVEAVFRAAAGEPAGV